MSDFPKSCPFCGSCTAVYVNSYLCGTFIRPGKDKRKHQSKLCVTQEREALEDRVEAMETAGDDLAVCCTSVVSYADVQKFVAKWKESKKSKP